VQSKHGHITVPPNQGGCRPWKVCHQWQSLFFELNAQNFARQPGLETTRQTCFLATSYVEAIASIDYQLTLVPVIRDRSLRELKLFSTKMKYHSLRALPTLNSPPGQSRAGGRQARESGQPTVRRVLWMCATRMDLMHTPLSSVCFLRP
jgi:hypothetical protein